jgi:nucleoside 2-deoxyribosyltransferase
MYIYFARSLRGDRATDSDFIKELIRIIKTTTGCQPQFDIPVNIKRLGLSEDQYIYQRDLAWIDQCEAMVAEVTFASHGVGYEIAYAKHVRKMPIFCAAQKDARVSAMISGADLPLLQYRGVDDLGAFVVEWLGDIAEGARA